MIIGKYNESVNKCAMKPKGKVKSVGSEKVEKVDVCYKVKMPYDSMGVRCASIRVRLRAWRRRKTDITGGEDGSLAW
jgi:hypothetical protein